MFLEIIKSPGIAHLSYLIGDGGTAAVVDPRIDIREYVERAREHEVRITVIYETHRNEDLVSGARALAEATGAKVLHGKALDFGYGEGVDHGAEERFGALRLQALCTPGHTDESISIALYDDDFGDSAVGVFTGDALFVGDVGRTDFYPERAEEVAGNLYDSLFDTLIPLGDQALIYPAHGSGSVCGDGMASREFSSLGHERKHNPRLQLSREQFIRAKVEEHHVKPPYFREMEARNLAGSPRIENWPEPQARTPREIEQGLREDLILLDVRSAQAWAASSIPGSIAMPMSLLSAYAGWFVPYDRPVGLVADDTPTIEAAVRQMVRLGYARIEAFLGGGISAWETSGRPLQTVPTVSAETLKKRLAADEVFTILDVRKQSEFEAGHLPGARFCFLGDLADSTDLAALPKPIVTFCGSGKRAAVAASLLRRADIDDIENCFGSMEACKAIDCPIEEGPQR